MSESGKNNVNKAVDSIQQRLTSYACGLKYEDIPADVVHTAKVRVIDTLGALMAGFFGEPCFIARNVAAEMPDPNGATVIGTRMKTTPDMAAFVNATTSRYAEINDNYHWPGSFHGHASDTVTPVLAVAELTQAGGRDFITGVILAYEVYLRFSDVFNNQGFDISNFCCLSTAMAGAKLLGLTPEQLSHAISMAVVPNVSLKQVRIGHQSMFKAAATGQAGRAGVFAAMKPTAVLVNVARGLLIDEAAMIDALKAGKIAGVGLDVTVEEPLSAGSPLWTMPNVVMTPHIAAAGGDSTEAMVDILCDNFARFMAGKPLAKWAYGPTSAPPAEMAQRAITPERRTP